MCISINDLVAPYVSDTALDNGYRAMTADTTREAEAREWANALARDVADVRRQVSKAQRACRRTKRTKPQATCLLNALILLEYAYLTRTGDKWNLWSSRQACGMAPLARPTGPPEVRRPLTAE